MSPQAEGDIFIELSQQKIPNYQPEQDLKINKKEVLVSINFILFDGHCQGFTEIFLKLFDKIVQESIYQGRSKCTPILSIKCITKYIFKEEVH